MRTFFTVLAVLVLMLSARLAHAQFIATDNRPEFYTGTTLTTSAVGAGLIMLTVASVSKDPTAMRYYLRQNETAVRAALIWGGGRVIADLGQLFGIPDDELHRFGRLLRRHRRALVRTAFEEDDTRGFVQLVTAAVLFDRLRT